jgi:hypothetical protein
MFAPYPTGRHVQYKHFVSRRCDSATPAGFVFCSQMGANRQAKFPSHHHTAKTDVCVLLLFICRVGRGSDGTLSRSTVSRIGRERERERDDGDDLYAVEMITIVLGWAYSMFVIYTIWLAHMYEHLAQTDGSMPHGILSTEEKTKC